MRLMFAVQQQNIKRVDDETPVMNSIDYVDAEFIFSDKWDGLKKTAILQNNILGTTHIQLDVNDRIKIPIKYLNTISFTVTVYGEDIDNVLAFRITTGIIVVKLADTGFISPPTLSLTVDKTTGAIDTEFIFTAGIEHAKEPFSFVWSFDDVVDDTQTNLVAKKIFDTVGTHTIEVSTTVEGLYLNKKIEINVA